MSSAPLRRHAPQASPEALAMLDAARGLIEAPIRAEIFGTARFQQHGLSLGETHDARVNVKRSVAFFPRLRDNIRVLREAHCYICLQERRGHHVSPAGEWLLDNFYVVVAQFKEIQDGLPRRYFRDLPVLVGDHLAGLPRIYGVAWAFVAHTDSAFDETLLCAFLGAYQQSRELTLGELWALPTTLRVLLIENLRRLSERVAAAKAARELANLWCDGIELGARRKELEARPLFDLMQARGVGRAFALQVMQRLHSDSGSRSVQGIRGREAIRAALANALPDPAAAQAQQQTEQAADNLSVSNAITSLRLLGDTDWRGLVARISLLMRLMQTSATFAAERDDTQDATLHAIERLARQSGSGELAVARTLLSLVQSSPDLDTDARSASPSHWLRGPGRAALRHAVGLRATLLPGWASLRRRFALPVYLATMGAGTLALTFGFVHRFADAAASPQWLALLALLAVWPASEAVIAVVNRLISESVPPRRLPRLALVEGIPVQHRVLVVVPAMLTSAEAVHALALQLERHHLANVERHAQFALLSDYVDADTQHTEADATRLAEAVAALDALEARYPTPADGTAAASRRFLLLQRERRWSDTEQRWIGWERKRGKLEELIGLLAEPGGSPFIDLGERSQPSPGTPYVVTLDSDTVLPPGSLRELVGVAAHPLNRPRVDVARRCVLGGYGILQPRIATPLPAPGEVTPFHWLFAGQGGVDPYSAATSEVYQDLFEEGTFSGKGLLNVQAMHTVLSGRLPQGQVLSHDLVEGAIARCGGVSDITLIEDAPMHADVAASRVHRWTRGDWQLWPLLLRSSFYGLRTVHRWKMIDNLRRSLVAPFSVALQVLSLAGGPISPWAVLGLLVAAFGGGPLLGAMAGLAPSRDDLALGHFYRQAFADVGRALGGTLWCMALLLQHALSLVDAIARATWRMTVSRRGLLQWTTAAAAQASALYDLAGLTRRHARVVVTAVLLLAVLLAVGTPAPLFAVALCALWAATPLWVLWASRPHAAPKELVLAPADRDYLLGVARDTWRLFEHYVGPASHDLPPDNVQTVPHTMVANRTSPTNIGLYLLAVACARQFGWIDTHELLSRCERTLATLAKLPRHRGHFLNWYDTLTLAVLTPAYVSTVDSGNLCGHLVALAMACDELASAPLEQADTESDRDTVQRLAALAAGCRRLADEAEFDFLFDPRRRLFHIGYRIDDQLLDTSFYDLLASESRLASLWAIAKGDVPVSHWGALGRPFYALGGDVGLRSWSGSMFEYLMPSLVLDEPPGSALAAAVRAAVHEQIGFARTLDVPWGMSESAYAASDHTLAYQYAPQGVPRLALRRAPLDEVVVAPYATVLAAMVEPQAALANLRRLEGLHARGAMGFVEALDYTAERQVSGGICTLVGTFMAHHQGMSIVALANVLLQGAPRRWGMGDARLGAVATLLQERVPREVSRLLEPTSEGDRPDPREAVQGASRELVPGETALQPTLLLSNGRYSAALRANGAGWSRFGTADVSRWRDDALRDAHGTFFYIRRQSLATPVSITQHPAPDAAAHYQASFHSDRIHLDAEWPDLRTRCTVWVSPEDDIELRRIELWNTSSRAITLELMSMFEVSLAESLADETHPAFAKLFVSADWDAADRALYFARTPRLASEEGLHAVHFIAHADDHLTSVHAQTDRARWLGRHREAAFPLARYDSAASESGERVTGLDPVASLSMWLTLPAHGTAHVTVATAAARSRAELETLVDRYRQASNVERSSLMSATFISIRLREMRFNAEDRAAMQTLTTVMSLFITHPDRSAGEPGRAAGFDRRALWRFGISADRPIIVVGVGAVHGRRLVGALSQALRWWSWGGVVCDLVVLNSEPRSYLMPLQLELLALRDRYTADIAATPAGRACGLHVLHDEDLTAPERSALLTLARVRLHADGRPLSHHVQELAECHDHDLDERLEQATASLAPPAWSGVAAPPRGRFDEHDGSFRFIVQGASRPQRPWVNVLANPAFGAQVSEAGAGYTWAGNSRLNQLTSWSNDPVADGSGEAFFVQDLRTREVWSVGAGAGAADTAYEIEHGQGVTTLRHRRGELEVVATWSVEPVLSVKRIRFTLHNCGTRTLRLRVVGVLEWVMGARRCDRQSVRTAFEALDRGDELHEANGPRIELLLATQRDGHAGFGASTAFLAVRNDASDEAVLEEWTCDRRELFDARGQRSLPDHLGERAGVGLDPCAAAATSVELEGGEHSGCVFVFGHGDSPAAARALAHDCVLEDAAHREALVRARWDEILGVLTVTTPDPLFDALVNRWLLYQTLGCRLWARAGFYQAGGAFGFRDQLQDAMALAVVAPELLRQQLLLSASRQFVEGDVQHWWHAPLGAGVRTRMSDDLLWLPHATVHYLAVTADAAVLDESVPFLEGQAIGAGAEDAYFEPQSSAHSGTLYEHGARAIDRSLAVGSHGLPLMGTGDWNDGMNRVGHEGRGESVWLGWFLCRLVADFAPIAHARGDVQRALQWEAAARGWQRELQTVAWDGEWFVRAFFDDGSPLGSHTNDECRIDLIAQAWAVLSGAATPVQQHAAMAAAGGLLVDEVNGLVRLLDPPLAKARPEAGYIQAYPKGVRENGGQYSHAGVWALMARAALGDADGAWALFKMLSPAHRSANPQQAAAYGLEPYVMAGDVYTHAPYVGRGGWSWYTGSAAWMHRAAVESICGLRVRGGAVCLTPQLPSHWPQVSLSLRRDGRRHEFIVCAADSVVQIAVARARGALELRPGEWLLLADAGDASCHLVVASGDARDAQVAAEAMATSDA